MVTSRYAGETVLERDTVSVPLQRKPLPAREAQIARIVYKLGEASANQVCAALNGELTNAAVRSMLQRLIAKQIVRRYLRGHCYYYAAADERQPDPREALRKVVDDHFGGCFARARAELERLNR